MYILSRIEFGTISQLALVIKHALLAALSALSMFSKRNVPMSVITSLQLVPFSHENMLVQKKGNCAFIPCM